MTTTEARDRVDTIRSSLPKEGLFAGKRWRLSPEPFRLPRPLVRELVRLGPVLQRFVQGCNHFYFRSLQGRLPAWIADYVDAGKPDWLLEMGRSKTVRQELPRVIRPDIILTDDGFAITELDNVPGGIGLTAWLNEVYSRWDATGPVIGGKTGMLAGFRQLLIKGGDILISDESAAYRPEMAWLARRLNEQFFHEGTIWRALKADDYPSAHYREVYRFFELFDLPNIVGARHLGQQAADGIAKVTPPYKAFLEEKLWLALLHLQPLRQAWVRELRESNYRYLCEMIPYSWIIDPAPLPHHAVLPGLDVNRWSDLASFSQSERQLVIKISGYSESAWGSRSVSIGQDLPQNEWTAAIATAIQSFPEHPYVMQRFHKGRRVVHPYWDEDEGEMRLMEGRVRLCPYYLPDEKGSASLCGVLATIVPAEKKIIHGMEEAILVPCALSAS